MQLLYLETYAGQLQVEKKKKKKKKNGKSRPSLQNTHATWSLFRQGPPSQSQSLSLQPSQS